jgi:hypothetical protein
MHQEHQKHKAMNFDELKRNDESAREIDKAISGCLMMVGFFLAAIIMCVIINMCSHG